LFIDDSTVTIYTEYKAWREAAAYCISRNQYLVSPMAARKLEVFATHAQIWTSVLASKAVYRDYRSPTGADS